MEDLKNLIPNCQKILTRTIPVLSKRNRKYCFDLPRIGIENHHAVGEIDRLLDIMRDKHDRLLRLFSETMRDLFQSHRSGNQTAAERILPELF